MKKFVAKRLKDIIQKACKRQGVPYSKRGLRRAKKFYLSLGLKDKAVAVG